MRFHAGLLTDTLLRGTASRRSSFCALEWACVGSDDRAFGAVRASFVCIAVSANERPYDFVQQVAQDGLSGVEVDEFGLDAAQRECDVEVCVAPAGCACLAYVVGPSTAVPIEDPASVFGGLFRAGVEARRSAVIRSSFCIGGPACIGSDERAIWRVMPTAGEPLAS